jgi:hypothetical protein
MRLDKVALGLAAGILWGAGIFLLTLWCHYRGGGNTLILLKQVYLGYSVSLPGAFIGLVWGFVDGFLGGWLLAWLYNRFARDAK